MPYAWTCTTSGSTTDCITTASSTVSVAYTSDIIFLLGIVIFFLSLPALGLVFSTFIKRHYHD